MTTAAEIKRKVNEAYCDVYLKRRESDGSYEADWLDITRHVAGRGPSQISYALDSEDYDIGIFAVGNVDLVFDNSLGKFNDVYDSRSLWAGYDTRHLTKVKIEAGYLDKTTKAKIIEKSFEGILDERALYGDGRDTVTATVLARESVFQTVSVPAGALSSGILASDAFLVLCQRGEVQAHMTVSAANIEPGNDIVIDAPSVYGGAKLRDVLADLLLLTNSVLYIDGDDNLVITSREHSSRVVWRFYLGSDAAPDNIYGLRDFNSGRQRVKNHWAWDGTVLSARSESHHLARFGESRKTISSSAVTDADVRQSVLDALRDEWQFPKRELEIETDYLANEVSFYDIVTLDVRPKIFAREMLPIAGAAVAGEAVCPVYSTGLLIEKELGFKVLGITHDLQRFTTRLKLREKGNLLNDGYLSTMATKNTSVTFTAESTKDINTAAFGMDAQKCKVEILDTTDNFKTNEFEVTRPTTGIVRLTTGSNITGTFRVLLVETED